MPKSWENCRINFTRHWFERAYDRGFPDEILNNAVYEGNKKKLNREVNGRRYELSYTDKRDGTIWKMEVLKGKCFIQLITVIKIHE
ncbi:MAG: hypothetical protein QW292_09280 [Candidatus Parvarchaeota archaeon]